MSSGAINRRRVVCVVTLALLALSARAQALTDAFKARLLFQDTFAYHDAGSVAAVEDGRGQNSATGSLRLMYTPEWNGWNVDAQYLASLEHGSGQREAAEVGEDGVLPATWWDLSDQFLSSSQWRGQHSIERLSVGYNAANFVIRVGRQALSWGSGQVFRPMDIVNPFSPAATDTEFKPGTDMLYGQLLFADGSDLQAIVVPRARTLNAEPTAQASTFAIHLRRHLDEIEMTLLAARDHGDWTAAIAVNGALAGTTWNVEFVPTRVDGGDTYVSALANISGATSMFGRNTRIFGEYFHNGFGVAEPLIANELPAYLRERLARGQTFVISRNFIALGATVECTPLLTIAPTVIADVNGGSTYWLLAATWSLSDNALLTAGLQQPFGSRGTEFGGIPISRGSDVISDVPSRAYLQLRTYF